MTKGQFLKRRAFGQIAPTQRTRTVIWYFAGRPEWEEIFVDEPYDSIENQEARFRRAINPVALIITPEVIRGENTPTVEAQYWRA